MRTDPVNGTYLADAGGAIGRILRRKSLQARSGLFRRVAVERGVEIAWRRWRCGDVQSAGFGKL
ncbi:hypothetical protein [Bradyrhizobium oligotrophicum]|uniref:hypothetical protein n=1 Tax=Bradyrhizobium oligotrophicum TaxID=44255 RepID=UPI001181C118|nr:hypothetical protein [Bradyrhizobium oligotrophicum]